MKAIIRRKYGLPYVLHIKDIDKPIPKEDEVLIKIYMTTVNRTDCGWLRGVPYIVRLFAGILKPHNSILGNEFAGEIEAIGENVTSFKIGDRVFGYDEDHFGAHAQYKTISENASLTTIPKNKTYKEIVACTEGVHYALSFIRNAKIRKDQKVLVNGATGAIGSAAVQLLKHFGVHITAVANTKNLKLIKSLGAHRVIDYLKEDFTKEEKKYDVILDAVGKSTFRKCKPLLVKKGLYLSSELGPFFQNLFLPLTTPLFGGKKVISPYPAISKNDVIFFKKLVENGEFKAVIDRTYPLENIRDAYKYVLKGEKTGNVLINVHHQQ